MSLPVDLTGRCTTTANRNTASITSRGALVVAPYAFDLTSFNELDLVNTAYNFYKPQVGKRFVVSGIIATGDKQIAAAADAVVEVYEAVSTTTTTVAKVILTFVLTQSTVVSFIPLNILVSEGKFINAKTDDDDVHMNIMGYYVPG